jgi:hypothetical protein
VCVQVAELEPLARVMKEADSFRVRCQRVGGFFAVPVSSSSSTEADKHKADHKVNKRGRDEEEEEVSCVCIYVYTYKLRPN